jgi:7-cyano-7-deazaguanine tRNA-ribosyltransferase
MLWFSQAAGKTPEPWKYFQLDGVLLNAYDILQKPSIANKMTRNGVHDCLNFRGPVMMDSGGFSFMMKKTVKIAARRIAELYHSSKPNIGVVLDHPLMLGLNQREIRRRQLVTLRNTERMLAMKGTSNPELMPVIHGHTKTSVEWFIKRLDRIADFKMYGLGSLVPSVFNARGVGGIHNVIEMLCYVRKCLPGKLIHVFGVGSTITMHLMFASGADSLDSSSWRTKAAYGIIQLPGTGDRYITGRAGKATGKNYLDLSKDERKTLERCGCPGCRETGLAGLRGLNNPRGSFELRALHNSYVFQREVEKARKMIKTDRYTAYVDRVVGKTRFSSALDLANSLK